MAPVRLIRASDRRRVAWRNGAGFTEEIAAYPDTAAGVPLWRISLAELGESPTAFSAFGGVDRVFTVVGDHGVTLEWDTHSATAPPWCPHSFAGGQAPRCIPTGATSALNVMVDAAAADAAVTTVDLDIGPIVTRPAEVTALFVHSGAATTEVHQAEPGDCLVVRQGEVPLRGDARGLLVRIRLHP
jgi:environmental stress-induced protein Ves